MFGTRLGLLATVTLALFTGCVWSGERDLPGGGNGAGGFGGTGTTGRGGNAGTGVRVDAGPGSDASCGQNDQPTTMLPPDLLLVQDKSLSMNEDPATGMPCNTPGCSKWDQMTTAINTAIGQTETTVRWGLKFFADVGGGTCAVNTGVDVAPAPMTAAAIATAIANSGGPSSSTPTTLAERNAGAYLRRLTDPNPRYIVLATDGQPTCGAGGNRTPDDANAIKEVMTQFSMGTHTFVIGIATTTNAMANTTLNQMAIKGGEPQAGATSYYPVANTIDLVVALGKISGIVTSCTFNFSAVPPAPENILVEADGVPIPKDTTHTNGWDYLPGMTGVQLYGTYCDNVKNQVTKNVKAIFGCSGVPIIP